MTPKWFAPHSTTVVLVASLSMTTGACGFLFSHAPPEGHEQMGYFTCTESDAGPIIDVIWGALNVLSAVVIAADPDSYDYYNVDAGAVAAVGLGFGALHSVAAAVGFEKSKKCRAAKRQLAERQDAPLVGAVVQAVVVSPAADTLEAIGARVQLVATAHASSGATVPNRHFTWSSSNNAVASVTSAGLVTAHANGMVVITASTDDVVGTAQIVIASSR